VRLNVDNKMILVCAKFGAELIKYF